MEEIIMKYAVNIGIFGVAFFSLLRYVLKRMEKQEEGYKEEIKRGAEREVSYQTIVRENQEIMKKQADSISDIREIKTILKIKTNEGVEE
ncbi:TPA: BhlA/UviB family holin-like peptide [Bacillus cereus]